MPHKKRPRPKTKMFFKLLSLSSLVSIVAAGTFRVAEEPTTKVQDMAKFQQVSAKSEEVAAKSTGGPVDWPPVGIGKVSFFLIGYRLFFPIVNPR